MSKCCMSKQFGGWCLEYPSVYLEEEKHLHCIFHIPKVKWEGSEEEFREAVRDHIDRAIIDGTECDLSGTHFSGVASFAKYGAKKPLPKMNLEEAVFTGDADFSKSVFGGDANFTSARFCAKALFEEAVFQGEAFFEQAVFDMGATFDNALFKGRARFFDSVFEEPVTFNKTLFEKELYMSWGSFKKGAKFEGTTYLTNPILKRPAH